MILAAPEEPVDYRANGDFLSYLLAHRYRPGDRLPSLSEIGAQMGISVGKLREQLEAARLLGLVGVRPRTGIRMEPYSFLPAVRASLRFALAQDEANFEAFSALRNCVEAGFWKEAAALLLPEDKSHLRQLVTTARAKLSAEHRPSPIQIPHAEHRELHLAIFRRLDNPFVLGLLEAYWEAYEAIGLNEYADLRYHQEVWDHHAEMVEAIESGDFDRGQRAFVEHTALLRQRA